MCHKIYTPFACDTDCSSAYEDTHRSTAWWHYCPKRTRSDRRHRHPCQIACDPATEEREATRYDFKQSACCSKACCERAIIQTREKYTAIVEERETLIKDGENVGRDAMTMLVQQESAAERQVSKAEFQHALCGQKRER